MQHFDIVIKNGMIIDPERKSATIANLGVLDGKINSITREDISAETVIDAVGKIVCPGIIDIHAHVEGNVDCAEFMVAMGVTTVYNGNCGMSPNDLESFFSKYEKEGFLINQLEQVGHTTLRETVGLTDRYQSASERQTDKMAEILETNFQNGAWGLSFGLEYVPGSSTKEILALSRVAARYGKLISIHTRNDMYAGLAALKEAINITRITGAAVNISHLVYQYGFGMATEALSLIENAFRDGLDISVDSGVYCDFATSIGSAVFDDGCTKKWDCDYDSIVAATGKYRGKRLTEEQFFELRRDYPNDTAIAFVGKTHEIFEILEKPYVMLSTDAGTMYDNGLPGHPQDAGSYPRFFKTMVREQNRISLMEAISKCSFMPAERLGLHNKGRIKEGADADILIFDSNEIGDNAQYPCYGDTAARPDGIHYVLVNGEVVVASKEVFKKKSGKLLKSSCEKWRLK